jgi:hypothetical protein
MSVVRYKTCCSIIHLWGDVVDYLVWQNGKSNFALGNTWYSSNVGEMRGQIVEHN